MTYCDCTPPTREEIYVREKGLEGFTGGDPVKPLQRPSQWRYVEGKFRQSLARVRIAYLSEYPCIKMVVFAKQWEKMVFFFFFFNILWLWLLFHVLFLHLMPWLCSWLWQMTKEDSQLGWILVKSLLILLDYSEHW